MTLYYAGQRLTASDLNPIMAKYKNANAQTGIVPSTNTNITVPTLVYNKGGGIVTAASSVLTLNKAGVWEFEGNFELGWTSGSQAVYAWIGHPINSAAVDRYALARVSSRAGGLTFHASGSKEFASGDQIAFRVWHNATGNNSTIVTELETWFSVKYVHGT